jgi:hypothetical protein
MRVERSTLFGGLTVRLFSVLLLSAAAVSIASAGNLEIGGSLNTSTGVSTGGLNAAYLAGTTWFEKGYSAVLFANDPISGSSLGGSTVPDATSAIQQFTDMNNGVVFGMDSDASDQFWASASGTTTGTTTITVPVGVFGATQANILLNDYYGVNGTTDATVIFNFVTAGAVTDTLTNGNQIDSATQCAANSTFFTTPPAGGTATCTSFGTSTSNAGNVGNPIATTTDTAWNAIYTGNTNHNTTSTSGTPFGGTSGSLDLSDIQFNLSAYSGDTLTSITIKDTANNPDGSRLALAAISVQAPLTATPEPSTIVLLAAGLGLVGFFGRRRMARQN